MDTTMNVSPTELTLLSVILAAQVSPDLVATVRERGLLESFSAYRAEGDDRGVKHGHRRIFAHEANSHRGSSRRPAPRTAAYLRFIEAQSYALSFVERRACGETVATDEL
ncbi:hypothetical protein ACIQCV_15775 [Dietzia maris]|uniref:hypothetical protein n=1 Tax=Dietzia maris TaxID=37915 RepID=UPI00344ECB2A